MSKLEVIKKCQEVLHNCGDDPADEMIKLGKALMGIGQALKGMSVAEARATMQAVEAMALTHHPDA